MKTRTAQLFSGPEFVSRLPPMKRILCLCPVPSSIRDEDLRNEGYECYKIGMAVSDPYLAYATPIERGFAVVHRGLCVDNKRKHPICWKGMTGTKNDFLKQIGYRDIGGLALALPMRTGERKRTKLSTMKLNEAIGSLRCVLDNIATGTNMSASRVEAGGERSIVQGNEFDLQCIIDETMTPTLDEARRMANDEPEMWEEIDLEDAERTFDDESDAEKESLIASPSVHAACALNAFLWQTTGGWRNTFA